MKSKPALFVVFPGPSPVSALGQPQPSHCTTSPVPPSTACLCIRTRGTRLVERPQEHREPIIFVCPQRHLVPMMKPTHCVHQLPHTLATLLCPKYVLASHPPLLHTINSMMQLSNHGQTKA
jgi:hypothetical protein